MVVAIRMKGLTEQTLCVITGVRLRTPDSPLPRVGGSLLFRGIGVMLMYVYPTAFPLPAQGCLISV